MAECVFCKEEFADNPELEPVVYAPCQQCDVLYCRPCLEEYLSKYESQCSVCKTKVKVRRSITMIADGEERRRAHDRRAASEASQASDAVRRVAPVAGELLEQAVDPAFLLQRRQADDDAASRREAERLQREFNQAPSRGPEEPDAATRALMEQLQREDAEARRRAAAEPRPQPPPAKRRKSADGLVQTTISLQPRAVIDVDDPGDETQLSGDPPPVDETQSPDADSSAPPAVPLGEASRSPPARPPAPAMDLTQDSSGDDEAPARATGHTPAARSPPPPRPRADDDELAYFRSQGARNASLHESSSSDDDDSLPRRSRSRERPAPRPSEVIVID